MTPFRVDYSSYGLSDYAFVIFYIGIAGILAVNAWFGYQRKKTKVNTFN